MERIIVRIDEGREFELNEWLDQTTDGHLYDPDVLAHRSSFLLSALIAGTGRIAYLPVQQPLMLESLACRPNIGAGAKAVALTRMVEYAVGEAYRRDAGELYFLTRDTETEKFALRHNFKALPDELKVYRLNLLETFGS